MFSSQRYQTRVSNFTRLFTRERGDWHRSHYAIIKCDVLLRCGTALTSGYQLPDRLVACMAGDLDCCVDILIHVAQRLRDSEDVPSEEVASAAKRVSDALTKEVGYLPKKTRQALHLVSRKPLLLVHTVYAACTERACWLKTFWVLQTDKHAERRLSALTDLFNAFHEEPKIQLQVLLATIGYAKSTSMAGLLALALKVELLYLLAAD